MCRLYAGIQGSNFSSCFQFLNGLKRLNLTISDKIADQNVIKLDQDPIPNQRYLATAVPSAYLRTNLLRAAKNWLSSLSAKRGCKNCAGPQFGTILTGKTYTFWVRTYQLAAVASFGLISLYFSIQQLLVAMVGMCADSMRPPETALRLNCYNFCAEVCFPTSAVEQTYVSHNQYFQARCGNQN